MGNVWQYWVGQFNLILDCEFFEFFENSCDWKFFIMIPIIPIALLIIAVPIVGIILLISSTQVVPLSFYGLVQNTLTGNLDLTQAYDSGRYWKGPFQSMITFPSTEQNVDFNQIKVRSFDGVEISMDISYQFHLSKEAIPLIFSKFQNDYKLTFNVIVKETIRGVSSNFKAIEFFQEDTKDTTIQPEMQTKLENQFSNYSVDIKNLQLAKISLPDDYETSIYEKQATEQEISVEKQNLKKHRTAIETAVITAQNDADARVLSAEGTESGRYTASELTIQSEYSSLLQTAESYKEFRDTIGLLNEELLIYLFIDSISEEKENIIFFTVPFDSGN